MRHITIACLALAITLPLWGTPAAAAEETYQETFARTEPLAADGKVYLMNVSGDVRIQTWDRNEVKIDAVKRSTAGSDEAARKNAARVTIEVNREDGRLTIETKYPEGRNALRRFRVSVDYTLTVPVNARLTVNTVSGDISVSDAAGAAKLASVSGSITAEKMSGGGEFTSVSGSIHLKDVSGDVEVSDVSGEITLSDVSGTVKAEAVSGSITADYLYDAESAKISSHSGDIVYDGNVGQNGRYTFETFSGAVTVTLPADAAFDFGCETFSGHIQSDFKAYAEKEGKGPGGHELRGTVNGGGADLSLSSFSGSIELREAGRGEKEGSRTREQRHDSDDD